MNVGSDRLQTIETQITYDATMLDAIDVVKGSGWPGGIFLTNLNDPKGVIQLGGAPTPFNSIQKIAVITFRPKSLAGTTYLNGSITSLTNTNNARIGGPLPRAYIAGNIAVQIRSSRRHVEDDFENHRQDDRVVDISKEQSSILSPSLLPLSLPAVSAGGHGHHRYSRASSCPSLVRGDANLDCLFNLDDVVFTQNYVAEKLFDPTYCSACTKSQLDVCRLPPCFF